MKHPIWKRILCYLMLVCLLTALPVCAQGASAFEKSIADFPESYKILLRQVHEKHPKWVFRAMKTGLSFYDAVATEQKREQFSGSHLNQLQLYFQEPRRR